MNDDGHQNPPRGIISAAARRRVVASVERCLRHVLIQIGRDWERCGKAACARTRRCRGSACEP